jgi:dipeptidase E
LVDRHIVAIGGGGFSTEPDNPAIDDFVLGLTGKRRPRTLFLPTATGSVATYAVMFYEAFRRRAEPSHLDLFARTHADLRSTILAQHVVYVGGGNTANLLAIWRVHGLDAILTEAWASGVVLAGVSAGGICWFESGLTDSFGPELSPLSGGLSLIPGSFCPHFDGEPKRRPAYHRLVGDGTLPAGFAADDGAALHFVGSELDEVVASRPGAAGYRVDRGPDGAIEQRIEARLLS